MDKNPLADELRALAAVKSTDKTRSKAARLRDVLPDVEAALRAGASYAEVLEKLNAHGLDMTMGVFNKTLYRLRGGARRQPEDAGQTPAAPHQVPPVPVLHDPAEPVDMDQLINVGKQGRDRK